MSNEIKAGEVNNSQRWKQAEARENYLEWLALSSYLSSLASQAAADKSVTIAADLRKWADKAHQRAIDLEPKQEAA